MHPKHQFQRPADAHPIPLAYVALNGVHYDLEIGSLPKEQGRKQRVLIDVEVGYPESRTRIPDTLDGLADGFDYGKVQECIRQAIQPKTLWVETLANRICDAILALPGALTCEVKVTKERVWPNVPQTSITVYRQAQ